MKYEILLIPENPKGHKAGGHFTVKKICLSISAYRAILSHLVDMEERKNEIVENFYPEESALRKDFYCFLEDYIKKLEVLVRAVQIVDKPGCEKLKEFNYLPYVIIGSTVEIEGGKNSGADSYRIVSPYEATNSRKDLSYMSALGKALMLKNRKRL